jgi:hypothetical protein
MTAAAGTSSVVACSGFIPVPCAPTHLGLTTDASGAASNGSTGLLANLPLLQPLPDSFFGSRLERVTDGTSNGGKQYVTPEAGWMQEFNCAGAPYCSSSAYHMFVVNQAANGGCRIFAVDPSTMVLTRVDAATLNGPDTTNCNSLQEWSSVNANRLYSAVFSNENTLHGMAYKYYDWTPDAPGSKTPTTFLVFNAGPHGNALDTGMPGNASMLDGLMTLVHTAAVAAPTVQTTSCGATPNCIQVSTTGGSMNGKVYFSFTEDAADAAGILHEQNLASCSGCFGNYTFSGTGSVLAANPPAALVSPAAVNWHLYAYAAATLNAELAVDQCDGVYSPASSTCSFPLTSIVAGPPTAVHHLNLSCEQTQSRAENCYIGMIVTSKDDTRFVFMTAGIGQDLYSVAGLWDTTKGLRWIDLSTATVHNGSTDAAGVSCATATDCWTAPTGALTRVTDPNDGSLTSSWSTGLHEIWMSLDGAYVFLQPEQSAAVSESTWLWDPATATVYVSSVQSTAASIGAHQAEGYRWWTGASSGNPTLDGEFDFRSRVISTGTAPANCANQVFSGVNCFFNYNNFSDSGTSFPLPNATSTGYANIGLARRNVHYSGVHQIPGDSYPYLAVTYIQGPQTTFNIATNGAVRSGCPGACVDTITTSGAHNFMPADTLTIAGVTDTTFNQTCAPISGSITWTVSGSSSFQCASVGTVNATSTGGTVKKADLRPGRALENEVYLVSHDGSGRVWRFAHECYNAFGSGSITGPNASISQDGRYALINCYDGTRSDPVLVELR